MYLSDHPLKGFQLQADDTLVDLGTNIVRLTRVLHTQGNGIEEMVQAGLIVREGNGTALELDFGRM